MTEKENLHNYFKSSLIKRDKKDKKDIKIKKYKDKKDINVTKFMRKSKYIKIKKSCHLK